MRSRVLIQRSNALYARYPMDPTNSGAGRDKRSKGKNLIAGGRSAEAEVLQTQQHRTNRGRRRLQKAQIAFLWDITTADSQLRLQNVSRRAIRGQRAAPEDQCCALSEYRLRYLFFGGGLLAFGGLSTLFCLRLRKKHGFLQVMSGIENGRRYNLDQEVVRIEQWPDGSERMTSLCRDIEHMISASL